MNITFEEAAESYLKYVKLKDKQSSVRSITNRVNNYLVPYFKGILVSEITTLDYLNWQEKINELNFKYSYKSTLHTCFATFLNFCMNYYDLNKNVASKVGNFKNNESKTLGNIWSINEFNSFIKVIDDLVYNVFFKFLFLTGVRLGESLALTFSDVDFKNNKIYIHNNMTRFTNNGIKVITSTKTKDSERTISINTDLKEEILKLKEYYKNSDLNFNENFFIFGGNKPLAPTTITRKKDYYCNLSRVKRIKIHEFRHSHACLLFQNNVPIDEISYRLGHSKISMTMDVYLKYLPKKETSVINTLNSLNIY